jgi:hypothetical protein
MGTGPGTDSQNIETSGGRPVPVPIFSQTRHLLFDRRVEIFLLLIVLRLCAFGITHLRLLRRTHADKGQRFV